MPDNDLDAYLDPAPRNPRERVYSVASRIGIAPEIADDYLKLTQVESGHNINVRDSARGAKGFGQVMPDTPRGTTRTVGGQRYNLTDPDQNIEAGLRYFSEGGSDPVARRLYYFGGPRARQQYQRTGRIPNISDGNMTAAQYVQATGGRKQQPTSDLDSYLDPQPSPEQAALPSTQPKQIRQSAPSPATGQQTAPSIPQGLLLPPGQRNRGAAYKPKRAMDIVASQPQASGEAQQRHEQEVRQQVEQEVKSRYGPYGSPTLTGTLHLAANPSSAITNIFKPIDQQIDEETQARLKAEQVAQEPEVTSIRKEYGAMPAAERAVVAPLVRGGAGILRIGGGIASAFGIAPNELSNWANKRADIIESGAANTPLRETRNSGSSGQPQLEEVQRGIPEKIATGLADLGVGIGEIVLLQKATGLSMPKLLALEGAAKASDKPVSEQLAAAGEGYALGSALNSHLSRGASAALFGVPTAAQTGYEVSQGRMSPLDAAIQTGVQAGAGAVLGGGRRAAAQPIEPAVEPRGTPVTSDFIERNRSVLSDPDFRQHLLTESVGGNAGEGRAAVNVVLDPEGRIVRFGNEPEQDLPPLVRERLASGDYSRASVVFKDALSENPQPEAIIPHRQPAELTDLNGGRLADFEDSSRSRGDVPSDIADLAARRRSEVQSKTQPPVAQERAAVEPANATDIARRAHVASGKNLTDRQASSSVMGERNTSPEGVEINSGQRFYHRDFGEVTESSNQKRVGKNRVRVVSEDGSEHVIKRASLTGAGNQRAVPIRDVAEPRAEPTFATPKPLPELRDNYRKPLKEYANRLYREVSPNGALDMLPTSRRSTDIADVYLSNTPDLALGQSRNKGILLEFEPADLEGQVNRSKPAWEPLYQQGQAEFIARYNKQGQYQRALTAVTIKPDAVMSNVERMQLDRALKEMELAGWTKTSSPDGTVYRRPPDQSAAPIREPSVEPVQSDIESYLEPRKEVSGEPANQVAAAEALKTRTSNQAAEQVRPAPSKPLESITSARKEMMREDRAELDLPELPTAERKSWRASLENAKPEDANRLADEVLNRPRALNDEETASLVVRAQEIKNRHTEVMREIGAASDPDVIARKRIESESLEKEFDKLTEATKKSGTEKGRALAAQKLTINQDFDLVSMKNRLKAAKGENLTPQENARVEDLHARLMKAESDLTEANERLAQRDLQKQIEKAARQRTRKETRKALDDEFADLRNQFAQARAEVKNVQGSGLAGLDPEGRLTALVAKMARNRVRAGITDAAQLVDDIHAAIKDSVEGITKRDIRDAISGYGLEPKGDRRSEDAKQLADIRTELRNLSKSEDIAAGRRLSAKDSARRKQLEKQEADLTRRMQVQDFERPERTKPQYTRETYEREKRVKELKAEFETMRYRATRSVGGKIADTIVGVGNIPKTLLSMADLSAVLRQGGVGYVQHPVLSTQAARDMLRSFTEHGFANVENAIKSSPEFENAKRSGVEFTGIDRDDPRLNKREEGYLGGGAIDALAKGRFNLPGKGLKAVKDFSERTFVSFLDSQRMRIFEHQAQSLRDMGLKGKDLDAALKSQAKYINIITGRGSLGAEGNKYAPALNLAMFSPRLVASRFQLLNKMLNPVAWARMPKGSRKLQLTDNIKFLVGTAAVLGLAKAAGAGVNTDPDDADFLKIKVGNTRFDTLAGLQQPMRFMLRMAKAIKGGETYSGADKGDIFADFARSKAAPEIGLGWDYLEGKNRLSGKKFEPVKDTARTLIPLPAQDFYEAIKEDGKLRGTIEALPGLLGVGIQTYKGAAEKPTTEAEKLSRRLIQRKMPDEARDQEQIDLDTKKSELRARVRQGEDVTNEVKALGSKLTERQAKGILAAKNKTRLQEDVNRLGIKDALLVYSVASSTERTQIVDILERKQGLIDMLPNSDRETVRKRWNDLGLGAGRVRFGRPDRPSRPSREARQ